MTEFTGQRAQVMARIAAAWGELQQALAAVPPPLLDGPPVVASWTGKDLLGHIATWDNELLLNIGRLLDPQNGQMVSYPNPDEFNRQTAEAKRRLPLPEILDDLAAAHQRLLKRLDSLSDADFARPEIARRIELDTYGHYPEHAHHLRQLAGGA